MPAPSNGKFLRVEPKSPSAIRATINVYRRVQNDPSFALDAQNTLVNPDDGGSPYFVLDFNVPPIKPSEGWVFGSGSSDGLGSEVDVILTNAPREYGVAYNHFTLTHLPDTDQLHIQVHADRTVFVGTNEISGSTSRLANPTLLAIGDLFYIVQYLPLVDYKKQLATYRERHNLPVGNAPLELETTPTPQDVKVGNWCVGKIHAGGSTSSVAFASHEFGKGLAIAKRMKVMMADIEEITHEARLLLEHNHPCVVHMAEDGDFNIDTFHKELANENSVIDVYFMIQPAMKFTLFNIGATTPAQRQALLIDTLRGVQYLHSKGIMHRDIKPGNIGVVLTPTARAVLLDLGSATESSWCDDSVGTVYYTPPEVHRLATDQADSDEDFDESDARGYDNAVDIWMACMSFVRRHTRMDREFGSLTPSSPAYLKLIERLLRPDQGPISLKVGKAIAAGMEWRPSKRPSATKLLQDLGWTES